MSKKTLLIIFYLLLSYSPSQNCIAQSTLNDTLLINNLLEVADSIMRNEPKNAKVLVDSAMVIANELGFEDYSIKCLRGKVDYHYYLGQLDKAIDDLFMLLSYHETRKDSGEIAICYNDIGITFADKMEFALSLKYLYKALKLERKKDREGIKVGILGNIGYAYFQLGKYSDAHVFFKKSLDLAIKIGDKEGIANANTGIGNTLKEQGNYDLALQYFEKALKIYTEIDLRNGKGYIYQSLGELKYYSKSYNEAIDYFNKAADIGKEGGDINTYLDAISGIAHIYNELGNPNKAILIYNEALLMANEDDSKETIIWILDKMNKIYASAGNHKKAYETLMKYSLLKDEVYNKENSNQIEELKIEFETEQKEREIANLKEVTEQRQMIIFLLVGSLALIGLVGYFGISRYRMKTQQNSMELEQRLLRSQMNPHFIFNSLSVIQGYIFKGSAKEAASYLSNFGKLMRNILENSREEYVMLDKEIETLNHYLELQNLRHGGKITYTIDVSENLSTDSVNVPPMLAQPFIENSIKHGMNENGEVLIIVKYLKIENNMKLIIEDNGIGIEKSKNGNTKSVEHKSLAISITEGRLQLLSKRAKSKYKLNIVDIGNKDTNKSGTRVEVELPYLEEF